ncbi:TIGR00725 family protein [Selenihalanaerobacter shriftii]|uniref:TIGR00725 family protein n=1 Tax=Selenihalanaerobacter shriftii TaxID=142842 RepID=A0A1T4K6H2_9FIRM|nr:TIGR00725 family protein [Selenihalanaerobacter shriftii]SJZ38058.1 hypothetical protein SAMN02745118_00645 [Selenihalanaerobacter shriftii]
MSIRVGVIGKSGKISKEVKKKAYQVGKEIALKKGILLSGGRDGVMEAVSKGAKEHGGFTVGIMPGLTQEDANDYLDLALTTGLGFDIRSNVLIRSSDVVIMINGGNGTFNEVSSAYLLSKPVIVFEGTGGWADKIKDITQEGKYLDKRKNIELKYEDSAIEVVNLAFKCAPKKSNKFDQGKVI